MEALSLNSSLAMGPDTPQTKNQRIKEYIRKAEHLHEQSNNQEALKFVEKAIELSKESSSNVLAKNFLSELHKKKADVHIDLAVVSLKE